MYELKRNNRLHFRLRGIIRAIAKIRTLPLFLLFAGTLLGSCDKDRNHPGYDYFPDMYYSNAYETYSPNPNFDDGITLRTPVEGTISREHIPYPYVKSDEDMALAGKLLTSPVENNSKNLERGEVIYNRFCESCHGEQGKGDGYLYTSGKYVLPPASLVAVRALNRSDGELFHTITVGFGVMGAHGSQIRDEDRWKIVLYIREELQKGNLPEGDINE